LAAVNELGLRILLVAQRETNNWTRGGAAGQGNTIR
jgi:hypothetical protein